MTEDENVDAISSLCNEATINGTELTVEMEAGVDDGLTADETTRKLLGTVEERHPGFVCLWAPGLGTRHGLSDSGYPQFSVEAVINQRLLARSITGRDIGLALHGSSGLAETRLQEAVKEGVVKVNWSSESLLIRSRASAEYYEINREQLSPKHKSFKSTAMDNGVQLFVSERYIPKLISRIELLGGVGQADLTVLS
jgi:fructose/tagatose bisphosphate aldolase